MQKLWKSIIQNIIRHIPTILRISKKCPQDIQNKDVTEILSDLGSVPNDLKSAINFNGGGFDNHRIFWNNLTPMAEGNHKDLLQRQ